MSFFRFASVRLPVKVPVYALNFREYRLQNVPNARSISLSQGWKGRERDQSFAPIAR